MNSIYRRDPTRDLVKSAVDKSIALIALILMLPLLVCTAVGIKIFSPGPILYKACRVGKGGKIFSMLKFRTMHIDSDMFGAITAPGDSRIYGFGLWLRRLKIDETLQFWHILVGDMSLVGPRPEDPRIVELYYNDWMLETLAVLPGVTGPGSVYGYIFGDKLLNHSDPEGSYVLNLLAPKLALERAYMERACLIGDLRYIFLTIFAIVAHLFGRDVSLPSIDVRASRRWFPSIFTHTN